MRDNGDMGVFTRILMEIGPAGWLMAAIVPSVAWGLWKLAQCAQLASIGH